MLRQKEPKRKTREMTDAEISAAIRHLDPDLGGKGNSETVVTAIGVCLGLILLSGFVALAWLYHRVS